VVRNFSWKEAYALAFLMGIQDWEVMFFNDYSSVQNALWFSGMCRRYCPIKLAVYGCAAAAEDGGLNP